MMVGTLYVLVCSICIQLFACFILKETVVPFYPIVLCLLMSYCVYAFIKRWTSKVEVNSKLCRLFEFMTLILLYLFGFVVVILFVRSISSISVLKIMIFYLFEILLLIGVVR